MKVPRFLSVILEETKSLKELRVLSIAFKRLWETGSKEGVTIAVVFSMVEAFLYAITPWTGRYLIDALNQGSHFGWYAQLAHPIPFLPQMTCWAAINLLTAVTIALSVLTYAAFNTSTGFARNATYRSQVTFGTEAFAHILGLSMDFHVQSKKGEVLAKTEQAIQNTQDFLYNSFFGDFLRAILSIALVLFMMYTMDVRLFAICGIALTLGLYTNLVFGSRVSREEKAAWKNVSREQAHALEVMYNIRETKLFGNEAFEVNRRRDRAEEQLAPLRRVTLLWRWLTSIENIWQNLGFAIAMFLVVLPGVFNHKLTIGEVPRFVAYYLMLFQSFMAMLFRYLTAQRIIPRLQDLKELLELRSLVSDAPNAVPFPGLHGSIVFQGIAFTYPRKNVEKKKVWFQNNPVLQDVDITIPKGNVTAIVGKTGGGKSTLMNLLMRLYDPTAGQILVDGQDVRSYTVDSYHRAFTVLSQDPYLFNNSVAYNIGYSRVDAPREQIIEAAKVAQADEFIVDLSEGYDTLIDERAQNISGGQKQRIALARAVLAKDAEVVILDEPTTGLDTITSREFMDELLKVFAGKTIIVISHDPAVMRRAHQVILVKKGRILQVGSHDQLLESCEDYKGLVEAA